MVYYSYYLASYEIFGRFGLMVFDVFSYMVIFGLMVFDVFSYMVIFGLMVFIYSAY